MCIRDRIYARDQKICANRIIFGDTAKYTSERKKKGEIETRITARSEQAKLCTTIKYYPDWRVPAQAEL